VQSSGTPQALIGELGRQGIEHTPEDIVRIAQDESGKVVFLESGNAKAGLEHIVTRHGGDFANVGIPEDQIPDLVMAAATRGIIVGKQNTRPIYEVMFNGRAIRVAVTVGNNGYIVGANPVG
jgi:hypothetical protein